MSAMMPNNKAERFRSLHTKAVALTPEARLKKLKTYRQLREWGMRGKALEKRAGVNLCTAKKWAAELGFDLGLGGAA